MLLQANFEVRVVCYLWNFRCSSCVRILYSAGICWVVFRFTVYISFLFL